jgi:predicted MFS family arabinose efflux permease
MSNDPAASTPDASPASPDSSMTLLGPSSWAKPVLVLALGTFAMGTDSFVLAGILPQLASGLRVSGGAAGQVVTAFALTYAISAPFLAAVTAKVPRKALMTIALTLFVAANLAGAAAPSLSLLLVTRVIGALGAAMFTPSASAAAVALLGPGRRGFALSVILGGLAVGTVFGVPVGTALGQHLGWQASLLFIAGISLLALFLLLFTLPALPIPPAVPISQRLALLINRPVLAIIGVGIVATASGILLYTYIAQILAGTAHITGSRFTIALVAWGVGAGLGAFGSGWMADRHGANRTLLVAITGEGLALLALGFAGSFTIVLPLMVVGGAGSWAINAPLNHKLTGLAPALPSVVISFNSSGTYLGQALGAIFGGLLLAHTTVTGLCVTASAGVGVTLLLHLITSRQDRRILPGPRSSQRRRRSRGVVPEA